MEKWNAKIARYGNFLQIAHLEGENWRTELLVWLMAYRSTPQTKTGTTPCYMTFGREVRSKLPDLKRETVGVPGEEVRERDWSSKFTGKAYADLKREVPRPGTYVLATRFF